MCMHTPYLRCPPLKPFSFCPDNIPVLYVCSAITSIATIVLPEPPQLSVF